MKIDFETILKKVTIAGGDDNIELTTEEVVAAENGTIAHLGEMASAEDLAVASLVSKDYGLSIKGEVVVKKVATDKNGTTATFTMTAKVDDIADLARMVRNSATVAMSLSTTQGKLFENSTV